MSIRWGKLINSDLLTHLLLTDRWPSVAFSNSLSFLLFDFLQKLYYLCKKENCFLSVIHNRLIKYLFILLILFINSVWMFYSVHFYMGILAEVCFATSDCSLIFHAWTHPFIAYYESCTVIGIIGTALKEHPFRLLTENM